MAFSDKDLSKWKHRRFVIEPYNELQVTPVGYDLRFGYVINPENAEELYPKKAHHKESVGIKIPPKKSVVVVTLERIYLSGKVIGTVHARSGVTAKGILVNSITVDPHWNGRLLLTFYNTSDSEIILDSCRGIATLILHSVETFTDTKSRKSGTRDLLEEKQRYSPEVTHQILTYLNKYEDSKGEKRYLEGRDRSKQYKNKSKFNRFLIRIYQDTCWFKTAKNLILSFLTATFLLLCYILILPDSANQNEYITMVSDNSTILSIVGIIFSIFLALYAQFKIKTLEEEHMTRHPYCPHDKGKKPEDDSVQ